MNIKFLILVVVLLLAAGSFYFYNSSPSDQIVSEEQASMPSSPSDTSDEMSQETPMTEQAASGRYVSYNEAEVLAQAATGKAILFFRASWCPTCRALDADIRKNLENIPADIAIFDIDYDSAVALKQKYGVTVQHTLVQVDGSGNLVKRWLGSPTLVSLLAQVK